MPTQGNQDLSWQDIVNAIKKLFGAPGQALENVINNPTFNNTGNKPPVINKQTTPPRATDPTSMEYMRKQNEDSARRALEEEARKRLEQKLRPNPNDPLYRNLSGNR